MLSSALAICLALQADDELIFDSAVFLDQLPHSVEAMFFLPTGCGGDITTGPNARTMPERLIADF